MSKFVSILFLILLSSSVEAQGLCSSLFEKPSPVANMPLSSRLLEAEGFRLASELDFFGDKITLLRDIKNGDIVIGEINFASPKYLYQWGKAEYQQLNIAQGEITKSALVKNIEKNTPDKQAYGRGYYVSIDPFDSESPRPKGRGFMGSDVISPCGKMTSAQAA